MWYQKANQFFFSRRGGVSALFFFVLAYFIGYIWLVMPPLAMFIGWEEETRLVVLEVVESAYKEQVVEGDQILAVNGRLVERGQLVFQLPLKANYTLTFERDGTVWEQTITILDKNPLTQAWKLSLTILAVSFWGIGVLTVQFARSDRMQPVWIGLGFQLMGIVIISPGPSQLGAPGGWIVGQVLVFYVPLVVLYLGIVPYESPLRPFARHFLVTGFILSTLLAFIATVEVLFLFPNTSLFHLIGIGSGLLLTLLMGCTVLVALGMMIGRLWQAERQSYARQQLAILLFILTLAFVPFFVLVILPVNEILFVPFPFVYSLFLLVPAGYFFVLHRQGYLGLDAVFSRLITWAILLLAFVMASVTGTYFLYDVWRLSVNSAGLDVANFILIGALVLGQRPVHEFVELVIYGRDPLIDLPLQDIQSSLSSHPEPATVTRILREITKRLAVEQTAVFTKDQDGYTYLAGTVAPFSIDNIDGEAQVYLRQQNTELLSGLPGWVEVYLPIVVRQEQIGCLLLSRPKAGYFHRKQVKRLKEIADILGFGLLVINLVDSMQSLSQRALYEKALQRQEIATEIHNEPLHQLTAVTMQLGQISDNGAIQEAVGNLKQTIKALRRIIAGLRPPTLIESVPWMVQQVVREFDEQNPYITVGRDIHLSSSIVISKEAKNAFYFVLTESLNNVTKHADATAVHVRVVHQQKKLLLVIKDNGVGMTSMDMSLVEGLRHQHIGVSDMHRWALIGQGKLEIEPNEPTGLTVRLQLPVE